MKIIIGQQDPNPSYELVILPGWHGSQAASSLGPGKAQVYSIETEVANWGQTVKDSKYQETQR